ncbi:alpha/beta hydrolase family protein [Roseateles cavernae]|uniref:alpha/beta hydrolase family protein n=1 Tax=Roseateles cavernae TaxID=3153578 RepID=UPI0032E44C50
MLFAVSRRILLALALIAPGLPAALAQAAPPAPSAAPAIPGQDLDWQDTQRQRAVPVRLYWPAQADGAPVPLIVFSHGIGGSRRGYSYLGQYWASQGYASLHVQHVGSDRQLWMGNPLGLVGRLQDAAQEREAIHRARDVSFALDRLLQGEWGARIDARRIVAAGHSYGANTSLLLAGARVARQGAVMDLRDERFKAALIISAPPFYGEGDPASILGSVSIPTLHITATEDVIRIPGYYSDAQDRLRVFDATGSATKSLVVFEGGSHSVFTDRDGTGGLTLNPKLKTATRELTLAFLSQVFDGQGEGLLSWGERHGGLLARWVRPGASSTSASR